MHVQKVYPTIHASTRQSIHAHVIYIDAPVLDMLEDRTKMQGYYKNPSIIHTYIRIYGIRFKSQYTDTGDTHTHTHVQNEDAFKCLGLQEYFLMRRLASPEYKSQLNLRALLLCRYDYTPPPSDPGVETTLHVSMFAGTLSHALTDSWARHMQIQKLISWIDSSLGNLNLTNQCVHENDTDLDVAP